jgi:MraZ protein
MRFLGEIQCTVDDKGRIKMPTVMKKQFPASDSGRFMIAKDIEDCLVIYPMQTWDKQEQKLTKLSDFNPTHRAFKNAITVGLTEVELDNADRFLISKSLMRYISSAKEVILKGQFDRIQIWDANKYEQYIQGNISNISAIAEDVAKYLDSVENK